MRPGPFFCRWFIMALSRVYKDSELGAHTTTYETIGSMLVHSSASQKTCQASRLHLYPKARMQFLFLCHAWDPKVCNGPKPL